MVVLIVRCKNGLELNPSLTTQKVRNGILRTREVGRATSTTLRFHRLAMGHNSGCTSAFRLFFGASDRSH